jgi:D-alanyl-D-alanine carboxypeptidase
MGASMKKIFILLILFLMPLNINASSEYYVVMDADSGRVLDSSNMNTRMLIASTTKIMTAIVALENGNLNEEIVVGDEISKVNGSMLYVLNGDVLTLKDLLYGLMLQSGNDAAMVIATNILGYDKFIKEMNNKAIKLGMLNTIYENPHGLNDETINYSTAYDLALLMRYAMKNNDFKEITSTKKYIVKNDRTTFIWYNKNKLLNNYKYTTGGKIGYTKKSGHVFVSSATKGKENLIIATIKDTDRFNTHENFYKKYFDEYDKYQILNKYTFSIKDKNFKKYHLYIKNDFYMMLKNDEKKKLSLNIVLDKNRKNIKYSVGYVEIKVKGKTIHKENIYAITKKSKLKKLKSLLFFWK